MASERSKYVMSVELALRREMAYREKLEALQPKQTSSSVNCLPSPKQISLPGSSCVPRPPSSTTLFRPTIVPRATTTFPHQSASYRASPTPNRPPSYPTWDIRPSSRPTFLSSITKPSSRPTIGPRPMATLPPKSPPFRASPTPKPIPQSPTWDIRPSSRPTIPSPITKPASQPSRPTIVPRPLPPFRASPTWGIKISPSAKPIIDLTKSPTHKRKEVPNEQMEPISSSKLRKLYCEVCKVHCTSKSNLQMHLMGQKHKSKMNGNGKIMDDPRLYCELCDIWCMNDFCFKEHVSGKNHIKKLQ